MTDLELIKEKIWRLF